METLIYQQHPVVEIATNKFIDVPNIIQYESTPLIEVVREITAGYTTRIPIYHRDGTYLAKVVGSQIFLTEDGKKAGVVLRHPPQMTVCELEGKTLFELTRTGPAALKTQAELYTPDGLFIRASDKELAEYAIGEGKKEIRLEGGGVTLRMSGSTIRGFRIGIFFSKSGVMIIGCNAPPKLPIMPPKPPSVPQFDLAALKKLKPPQPNKGT